jgi:hypothetical protein
MQEKKCKCMYKNQMVTDYHSENPALNGRYIQEL